jgi:hypothetical protein
MHPHGGNQRRLGFRPVCFTGGCSASTFQVPAPRRRARRR